VAREGLPSAEEPENEERGTRKEEGKEGPKVIDRGVWWEKIGVRICLGEKS